MSFAGAAARLQEAVFGRLGDDAIWEGVAEPVRVLWRESDDDLRFEAGSIIATGRMLRVRRSEVPAPADGHSVQILDEEGAPIAGALFAVAGEPRLDRKGVWHCQLAKG